MGFNEQEFVKGYEEKYGHKPSKSEIKKARERAPQRVSRKSQAAPSATGPAKPAKPVKPVLTPEQILDLEKEKILLKKEGHSQKERILQERILKLEDELRTALFLEGNPPETIHIIPKTASGTSGAVAVGVFSDTHNDEMVTKEQTGGLNEYNPTIAEARFVRAWQGFMRLFDIVKRDNDIKEVIIALLGDFFSGNIHEDQAESNYLGVSDAILFSQKLIYNGLKFLLEYLPKDVHVTVVCHMGNHGRMTKKQRVATEAENSHEWVMYNNLRLLFDGQDRLTWQISRGYHSFVTLFEKYKIRFHHGHNIKYQDGVGGITIPVNKRIARWNKANRDINLDVFGHFHQFTDAPDFICNGSLIGYNAYAISIGAGYEPPKQGFFLVNEKYNDKIMVSPIFVEEPGR